MPVRSNNSVRLFARLSQGADVKLPPLLTSEQRLPTGLQNRERGFDSYLGCSCGWRGGYLCGPHKPVNAVQLGIPLPRPWRSRV